MLQQIFQRKDLDRIQRDADRVETSLKKTLGSIDLVALGIGAIIGTGIFAVVGTAAAGGAGHLGAGPGVTVSFIITAVACAFCALCYAEFASLVPISGSAYTYSYATLGELVAWIIGWDLIIEYSVGNVAVAIGWAAYAHQLLIGLGIHFPAWLSVDYRSAHQAFMAVTSTGEAPTGGAVLAYEAWTKAPVIFGAHVIFNLLAIFITLLVSAVLVIGVRESARANIVMVILNLSILGFFIFVGATYVQPENWTPFFPNGFSGVWSGAALIFFAFIGFDAISTAAEECKNPGRDMPIGIIGSLVVCTLIYVATALVLTGMTPWNQLGVAHPLAQAFVNRGLDWAAGIIALGAVISMTAVLLVFQLGQPRIFFSMSRDGLLPKRFTKVHPRFKTPHVTTIWSGVVVAAFAAIANINEIVELTNIGTLFAFVLVCAGVIILRYKEPDRVRVFRTPFVPVVPLLGIAMCLYLMAGLPWVTWVRFGAWLIAGLVIYFLYGYRHSRLRQEE